MLELINDTDWSAGLFPGWSRTRQRQLTLVVKAGFRFDAQGRLTPDPQPAIEAADRYRDDPESSSLEVVSEIVPFKQGGELLLCGSAHPGRPGQTGLAVEVGLRQGNRDYWTKQLLVFGPRRWESRLLAAVIGRPGPIDAPVPLIYEHAYGGCDPAKPEQRYLANPAGTGFSLRGMRLKELSLPQLEIGPGYITGPTSRPCPAGFGPLAPHWEPRCQAAGDIDADALQYGGCPWSKDLPADSFNAAPVDQRFDKPFAGEMTVSLKGLLADAPQVLLQLPALQPHLVLELEGKRQELAACCDTLLVDADQRQVQLVWRCAIPWDIKREPEATA